MHMADGGDSNPRWAFAHAGFQDRCLKPLGHPSFLRDQRDSKTFPQNKLQNWLGLAPEVAAAAAVRPRPSRRKQKASGWLPPSTIRAEGVSQLHWTLLVPSRLVVPASRGGGGQVNRCPPVAISGSVSVNGKQAWTCKKGSMYLVIDASAGHKLRVQAGAAIVLQQQPSNCDRVVLRRSERKHSASLPLRSKRAAVSVTYHATSLRFSIANRCA